MNLYIILYYHIYIQLYIYIIIYIKTVGRTNYIAKRSYFHWRLPFPGDHSKLLDLNRWGARTADLAWKNALIMVGLGPRVGSRPQFCCLFDAFFCLRLGRTLKVSYPMPTIQWIISKMDTSLRLKIGFPKGSWYTTGWSYARTIYRVGSNARRVPPDVQWKLPRGAPPRLRTVPWRTDHHNSCQQSWQSKSWDLHKTPGKCFVDCKT
jgi:hypothetical protein